MTDFTTLAILVPLLLAVGAVAGTLAGLLGVGGGIVIVPVLYWLTEVGLLDVDPSVAIHFAVATSLLTIIPTSISSARAHHRKGSIDVELFRAWAPFIVVGALAGGVLAANANAAALSAVFGGIAILVVLNMLNPNPIVLAAAPPASPVGRAAIAGPIGAFSAMMGIGGGTLSVPALTLMSFPVHRAVGTAALFGLVIAVPGILGYAFAGQDIGGLLPFSVGFINVPAAIVISIATFIFAPIGANIAHRLNARALRLAFAGFLALSGLKMLFEAFGA
ncbi:sulfite exporter TauE/SafE family protein [Pseudooctadecabacter jejudonensis]|uniref:Probable membrane transporter protein n=1 Tax=Pseudooctadecabacter jejudonensis TaxID=1391910 RepID=A0A1Y5TEA0_9RHOB|nr:sulfite exporter TauE/SafE family protein [Pseudooctadecabacter jejudonensis]SLN61745.1 Sulfite exporter TauE/SafE [Pseudooctadecabacter jejudonensis]